MFKRLSALSSSNADTYSGTAEEILQRSCVLDDVRKSNEAALKWLTSGSTITDLIELILKWCDVHHIPTDEVERQQFAQVRFVVPRRAADVLSAARVAVSPKLLSNGSLHRILEQIVSHKATLPVDIANNIAHVLYGMFEARVEDVPQEHWLTMMFEGFLGADGFNILLGAADLFPFAEFCNYLISDGHIDTFYEFITPGTFLLPLLHRLKESNSNTALFEGLSSILMGVVVFGKPCQSAMRHSLLSTGFFDPDIITLIKEIASRSAKHYGSICSIVRLLFLRIHAPQRAVDLESFHLTQDHFAGAFAIIRTIDNKEEGVVDTHTSEMETFINDLTLYLMNMLLDVVGNPIIDPPTEESSCLGCPVYQPKAPEYLISALSLYQTVFELEAAPEISTVPAGMFSECVSPEFFSMFLSNRFLGPSRLMVPLFLAIDSMLLSKAPHYLNVMGKDGFDVISWSDSCILQESDDYLSVIPFVAVMIGSCQSAGLELSDSLEQFLADQTQQNEHINLEHISRGDTLPLSFASPPTTSALIREFELSSDDTDEDDDEIDHPNAALGDSDDEMELDGDDLDSPSTIVKSPQPSRLNPHAGASIHDNFDVESDDAILRGSPPGGAFDDDMTLQSRKQLEFDDPPSSEPIWDEPADETSNIGVFEMDPFTSTSNPISALPIITQSGDADIFTAIPAGTEE